MPEVTVPPDEAGGRLDRFLASLEDVGSRAAAERLIEAGAVTVDGTPRAKSHRLAGGEQVAFPAPEEPRSALEPQQLDLSIPYRDEHLLVVDKPAGLIVHPVPGYDGPTLVHGPATPQRRETEHHQQDQLRRQGEQAERVGGDEQQRRDRIRHHVARPARPDEQQ